MNDQQMEQEIQEKGLTAAPRITADDVQALMDRVRYFREGGRHTTTLVHAYLDGTYYLGTGFSACVSLENFDAELGFKYAKAAAEEKARTKLWQFEGWKLARNQQVI